MVEAETAQASTPFRSAVRPARYGAPMDGAARPPGLEGYDLRRRVFDAPHAEVWDAVGSEGRVALKVPRTAEARVALAREDALLRRIRLRGLVERTAGGPDGAWMATRWVEGEHADAWATRQPVSAVVDLAAELALVLAELHAAGVAHGDVKPSNIVVQDDQPVLLDLGMAAPSGSNFSGTPGYAAPEQLGGTPPTPASDVYALGVTLFVMLVGEGHPFSADACAQALVPSQRLPWVPGMLRPDIPTALDGLFFSLLHPRSAVRPSARRTAEQLRSALSMDPGGACPEVFAAWQVLGTWFRSLRREVRGGLVVLQGGDATTRDRVCAWLGQAAAAEGLRPADLDHPASPHSWVLAAQEQWPALRPWALAGCPVVLLAERPRQELIDAGVQHIPLPKRQTARRWTSDEEAVLAVLRDGPVAVSVLADALGTTSLDLLDTCEPLFEAGAVEEREGGRVLALRPSQAPSEGSR